MHSPGKSVRIVESEVEKGGDDDNGELVFASCPEIMMVMVGDTEDRNDRQPSTRCYNLIGSLGGELMMLTMMRIGG